MRKRRESLDVERYVNPTSPKGEVLTDLVLFVDPAEIPRDLLMELVVPDADGRCRGRLYDRPVDWFPKDTSRFEIELVYTPTPYGGGCNFCPGQSQPAVLEFRWEGGPVCEDCAPDDLVELRDAAYRYANEQTERRPHCTGYAWDDAIREYLGR
jgi:hypothetical protein